MSTEQPNQFCPQCGTEISPNDPGGICPTCLVVGALSDDSSNDWLSSAPDEKGLKIGNWTLLEQLGEGAFGQVYRAKQEEPVRREGALKILKEGLMSSDILARFDAERQALSLLDHPGIATMYDLGETPEGRPWFAMELIDGVPVTDFCRDRDLSTREKLQIFLSICDAVNHAHENNIVHRDLKPSNVLISANSKGEPQVKLIDFGVAKALEMPLTERTLFTHAGVLIGTPEYMSPEQASGKSMDLDARSDVFSLGVLLFELLTGATPISRAKLRKAAFDEILSLIREEEPKRPSTVNRDAPKISSDLDWIALKALEKDRERRYPDSGEFAKDIERFLEERPVNASKPDIAYRIRKFVSRNNKLIAGISIAGLLALAGTAGAWWWGSSYYDGAEITTAPKFIPEKAPRYLPDTPLRDPRREVEGKTAFSNFPLKIAKVCRRLRDHPDDESARLQLWGMLAFESYPERVGPEISSEGKIIGAKMLENANCAVAVSTDGRIQAASLETGEIRFSLKTELEPVIIAVFEKTSILGVGGKNGEIQLFNFSGEPGVIVTFRSPDKSPIQALAFSQDGKKIFAGNKEGTVQAWKPDQPGEEVWSIEAGQAVQLLEAHPDRTHLAVCLSDGNIQMFQTKDGTLSSSMKGAGRVSGLSFSKDWRELIVAREEGETRVYDIPSGVQIREATADSNAGRLTSLVRDDSTKYFAVGGSNGRTVIHPLDTNREASFTPAFDHPVSTLEMKFKNGKALYLWSAYDNGSWRSWNLTYSSEQHNPVRNRFGTPIRELHVNKDITRALTSQDSEAQLWNLSTESPEIHFFPKAGYVWDAAFVPGSDVVRFVGRGGTFSYNWKTREPTGESLGIPKNAKHVRIAGDGLSFAASYNRIVQVWKLPPGKNPRILPEIQLDSEVTALTLSPDGKSLAVSTKGGETRVFETNRRIERFRFSSPDGNGATSLALSDSLLACGFSDGSIQAFNWKSQRQLPGPFPVLESRVEAIAISPANASIAAGDFKGNGVLFHSDTGQLIGPGIPCRKGILTLNFSAEGKWLMSNSRDDSSRIYDARSGDFLFRPFRSGGEKLFSKITPDGSGMLIGETLFTSPSIRAFPLMDHPVPEEVLDYAEAFAGIRIKDDRSQEFVPFKAYESARSKLRKFSSEDDSLKFWTDWMSSRFDAAED